MQMGEYLKLIYQISTVFSVVIPWKDRIIGEITNDLYFEGAPNILEVC